VNYLNIIQIYLLIMIITVFPNTSYNKNVLDISVT